MKSSFVRTHTSRELRTRNNGQTLSWKNILMLSKNNGAKIRKTNVGKRSAGECYTTNHEYLIVTWFYLRRLDPYFRPAVVGCWPSNDCGRANGKYQIRIHNKARCEHKIGRTRLSSGSTTAERTNTIKSYTRDAVFRLDYGMRSCQRTLITPCPSVIICLPLL